MTYEAANAAFCAWCELHDYDRKDRELRDAFFGGIELVEQESIPAEQPSGLTDAQVFALYVAAGWEPENRGYLTDKDAHILADRLRRFAVLAGAEAA